jgi:hypothetical protein
MPKKPAAISQKPRQPPPTSSASSGASADAINRWAQSRAQGDVATPAVFNRARKGEIQRRVTVYLPVDIYKRLAMFCAEHDQTLSDVTAEALSKHVDV